VSRWLKAANLQVGRWGGLSVKQCAYG
jgi:hypothetical protein